MGETPKSVGFLLAKKLSVERRGGGTTGKIWKGIFNVPKTYFQCVRVNLLALAFALQSKLYFCKADYQPNKKFLISFLRFPATFVSLLNFRARTIAHNLLFVAIDEKDKKTKKTNFARIAKAALADIPAVFMEHSRRW